MHVFENIERYQALANAIVLQAVEDYRQARRDYLACPINEDAQRIMRSCEKFFLGSWFRVLTNLDGKALLEQLQKETESPRMSLRTRSEVIINDI